MTDVRPSKADCLDGFAASIGCVDRLGPWAFPERDIFDPGDRIRRAEADRVVSTRRELVTALDEAAPDAVIWVDGSIDVGPVDGLRLERLTLASGYGMADEVTGTLHTSEKPRPLFHAGDDVRLTGLRIHGDEFAYFDPADRHPNAADPIYRVGDSAGVFVHGDDVELDNLKLSGWTYAGISVQRDGCDDVRTHIHHVDVVDNPTESLGYGVTVVEGRPLVELSYFDNNRHSMAGSGWKHCGYIFRFNVVGGAHVGHAIDMHGERVDGFDTPIAGRRTDIYNNAIKLTHSYHDDRPRPAVKFRGTPVERSRIVGNWFFNGRATVDNETNESPIRQLHAPRHSFRQLDVTDNVYGTQRSVDSVSLTADAARSFEHTVPDVASSDESTRSLVERVRRWARRR